MSPGAAIDSTPKDQADCKCGCTDHDQSPRVTRPPPAHPQVLPRMEKFRVRISTLAERACQESIALHTFCRRAPSDGERASERADGDAVRGVPVSKPVLGRHGVQAVRDQRDQQRQHRNDRIGLVPERWLPVVRCVIRATVVRMNGWSGIRTPLVRRSVSIPDLGFAQQVSPPYPANRPGS